MLTVRAKSWSNFSFLKAFQLWPAINMCIGKSLAGRW